MKIEVTIGEKTYSVSVDNLQGRPIIANVDGEEIEVWPKEPAAAKKIPMASSDASGKTTPAFSPKRVEKPQTSLGDTAIIAPIPGVIVEVSVKAGDAVKHGQELCVLEAMKMKNSIRAGRDGTIKAVHAKVGEHVHQSQLLAEYLDQGQA